MVLFLDTNVLLHYDFEQADWPSIVGEPVERVLLSWVNLHELDRLKDNHPSSSRRDRARRVLSLLESVHRATSGSAAPRLELLGFCRLQPVANFDSLELDATNPDHRLVVTALRVRNEEGLEVGLVTHDTTPRIVAELLGVPAFDMPAGWLLPASEDPRTRRIRELDAQLAKERSRRPKLSLGFDGVPKIELERAAQPIVLNESLADAVATLVRPSCPLPSSAYRNVDPSTIPGDISEQDRVVERYWKEVRRWVLDLGRYLRDTHDLWRLDIDVGNKGSSPATDVAVRLDFPSGLHLHTRATVREPPSPPDPPSERRQLSRPRPYRALAGMPYGAWVGTNVSPVTIGPRPSGEWSAHVRIRKVAQTTTARIDPIWVEFMDDPRSFGIKASVLADELPEEIELDLHVVLLDPSPSEAPTAEEIVALMERLQARDGG